jgi:NAD(P)-dependent dehydrogenase (short-subunit alcohol dehydrogenase family)
MSKIVITGASRGIGLASALVLARAGHSVVAAMRKPESLPEFENLPIRVEAMDVDSDQSVRDCFARVLAEGPIDALVNNAGIERTGSVEETPFADFRTCMETNYFGVIRCIQAVLPSMRERRAGVIVNVSSVAGKVCSAPMTPYAASKFALEALSEGLAQEMKPFGVRVAVVQPGIIETRMARNIANVAVQPSAYPNSRRIAAIFTATLANGAGAPELVAGAIREIVEGDTGRLRHPAGPDALPLLAWRASMNDEEWIDNQAVDDETWLANNRRTFGPTLELA